MLLDRAVLMFLVVAIGIPGSRLVARIAARSERFPMGRALVEGRIRFFKLVGEAPRTLVAQTRSLIAWLTLLEQLVFLADAADDAGFFLALASTRRLAPATSPS